ncbi:MAG: DUF1559 domain-containing protein [Pirellulales bacterium]|nr:DUF1559 domain-containing protein [Pirellulales bacterium]
MAVIAVLVAILLPAVQRVRANARSAQSKNNLSQMGKALKNYEGQFGRPLAHGSWRTDLAPFVDEVADVFVDPSDADGEPSYALTNKVVAMGLNDHTKITIIESDSETITIDNGDCAGGSEPVIDGDFAVRHLGMTNALLYGGSVKTLATDEIDLADTTREPLVVWWLPDREHGSVCGTVVTIDSPNSLPDAGGSNPDAGSQPDGGSESGGGAPSPSDEPCGSLDWTGGSLSVEDTVPTSLQLNSGQSMQSDDTIFVFKEQCGLELTSSVSVNISPLDPPEQQVFRAGLCVDSPGTIPAGTRVDVYFLHFDPVTSGQHIASGELQFSRPILGIIHSDDTLLATDTTLGHPGTTYSPTSYRGLECSSDNADELIVSPDMKNVVVEFAVAGYTEQVRIIVAADDSY